MASGSSEPATFVMHLVQRNFILRASIIADNK